MTTEQIYTKVGEWYWGAKCPECGEMAAHSKGDSEKPGGQQVTMTCPNGHFFPARTEELLHFEWRPIDCAADLHLWANHAAIGGP